MFEAHLTCDLVRNVYLIRYVLVRCWRKSAFFGHLMLESLVLVRLQLLVIIQEN
jgi:hypothetical protein